MNIPSCLFFKQKRAVAVFLQSVHDRVFYSKHLMSSGVLNALWQVCMLKSCVLLTVVGIRIEKLIT